MFRTLEADEIECRVGICNEKGVSLLLYKDARCDMMILDETVGAKNWQRKHDRDNANCIVSIWDAEKSQWISKEDTGTESNTEAQKGLASDSFKRACVNWGIGRELYTAPFIWVPADSCTIRQGRNGKPTCKDRFRVRNIRYSDAREITALEIENEESGSIVYRYGKPEKPKKTHEPPIFRCENCGEVLQPYSGMDGRAVGVRKHAEASKNQFGRVLCLRCIEGLKHDENAG